MPNVLHLISSSGFFGAENVLVELGKELQGTEFSPIVGVFNNLYSSHLEIVEESKRHHLPVAVFPCRGRVDFRAIMALRNFLKNREIDIVHSHGYKSNLYGLAASMGKNVSRITTCHNWLGEDVKMRFYASLDKTFLSRFDKIVAVSEPVRAEILKRRACREKALIIKNGINLEKFQNSEKGNGIRKALGIEEASKVIGIVGRLSEEKGHLVFIEAAKKVFQTFKKVVFLIVGDGPMRQQLEERANGAIPAIFTGFQKDMQGMYAVMDFFVLPSFNEGLPMVLLEAMASEKPVVATKVGAIPKVIDHGRNGLLIEAGDVDGLAASIKQLLHSPEKAREMGKRARERIEREYSSEKMAEKYVEVYREVLRKRERNGK